MGVFDKGIFVRVLEAGSVFMPSQVQALAGALEAALTTRNIRIDAGHSVPLHRPAPSRTQ